MTPRGTSIEQVVTLVVLSLLVIGCFVILRPFLAAILWALILAISTWPAYRWLQSKMRGWRTLAATLMTLLLAAVFVLPLAAMGWTMADDVTVLAGHIRQALEHGAPAPPSWVAQIPVFGQGIHDYWQGFSEKGSGWLQDPSRYLGPAKDWLLRSLPALVTPSFSSP
jgi:predicted PurR-regulated permease PerM